MKKLLVLTDFTANSFHAEEVALRLACKLNANIILYHTLPYIPLIPSDSSNIDDTGSLLFENSRERLKQEADTLKQLAQKLAEPHPNIDQINGDGGLGHVIADLTNDPDIEMVIMGGRSGGAFDHILSGSDTAVVIRKALKPVLVIPMNVNRDIPKKIAFATDFGTMDIPAVGFLQYLSTQLGSELDIVHMIQQGEVVTEIAPEMAFREFLNKRQLHYSQQVVPDVHQGLQQYCEQKGINVLSMTHGHHSFISRLLGHSETNLVISDQRCAVLVFPPGYKYLLPHKYSMV